MQIKDLIFQMMFCLLNGEGFYETQRQSKLRSFSVYLSSCEKSEVQSGSFKPSLPVTADSALTSDLDFHTLSCLSESSSEMKRALNN